MAVYRTIQLSFWTDSKVDDDFTPEDKYFYLYLLTNPHTNICGCYEIGEKQFCRETGYNSDTISRLISRFVNVHNVIRYDKNTKEILILNWHKYNWTKSEDLKRNVRKVAEGIKSDAFREYVFALLEDPANTVPTPSPHPVGTSVTVTDTDTVTDAVSGKFVPAEPKKNPVEEAFGYNQYLLETVNDWIKFKKEQKRPYKPVGLKGLITTIQKNVTEYGEDAVINVINESIASNYQGIVWDKLKTQKNNYGKKKYSFADMLREDLENEQNGNGETFDPFAI